MVRVHGRVEGGGEYGLSAQGETPLRGKGGSVRVPAEACKVLTSERRAGRVK